MLGRVANKILRLIGYQLSPLAVSFPVEFDDEDKKVVQRVLGDKLTMTSAERLFTTLMATRYACSQGIPGDFVECGVWRGGNSILAADVFRRFDSTRKVHLFDTFAGMTEPTEHDVDRSGQHVFKKFSEASKNDHNAWCYASLDEVMANVSRYELSAHAKYIKGDIVETLERKDVLPDRISVLRLDTDWYESTKKELEVLYPRLQVGGVLIVDDYGHWGGARKAVDEYFNNIPKPFLAYTDYTGRVGIKVRG
jgi:O-methyltransferase